MTTLLRLCAATAAVLSMVVLASSSSGGEGQPGRWQLRELSGGLTYLQFVHEQGDVWLMLSCNKGRTEGTVDVETPVGSAVVKAGQTARLTVTLPERDAVTMDAKLDRNGERIKGQTSLRRIGPLLVHAGSGPVVIEVRGAKTASALL